MIPLLTPSQDIPKLVKAASNVGVAAEMGLDCPEDLTNGTSAQNGSCTPLGQAGLTSVRNRGR
jgi:hypothetical protein